MVSDQWSNLAAQNAFSPLLSATADGSTILVDERDFDRAQEVYAAFFGNDTTPLTGGVPRRGPEGRVDSEPGLLVCNRINQIRIELAILG